MIWEASVVTDQKYYLLSNVQLRGRAFRDIRGYKECTITHLGRAQGSLLQCIDIHSLGQLVPPAASAGPNHISTVIHWSNSNITATTLQQQNKDCFHTHISYLSEHKLHKFISCAVCWQCRISTQTRQISVSVSVSVWQRVSARPMPLDPPPLVSSPNADPPD